MEPISKFAKEQYELVRESRKVLFTYCKTISLIDFVTKNSSFGRGGSIRNLFIHIANTYQFWIAKHGLNKDIIFTTYDSKESINDIIYVFDTVDIIMYEFIDLFKEPATKLIDYEINGVKNSVGLLKLFTHVITHEFHHKGQVLSISRHLGYTPVDTDIIR